MAQVYRFGIFAFDTAQLELRRLGHPVRLQPQPARVLAVLLESAGQLVPREDFRKAIWGDETFVDFDRGLNFCVGQIRTALGDDASTPRFIRTIPKKGYEFICPLESDAQRASPSEHRDTRRSTTWLAIASAILVAAIAASLFLIRGAGRHHAIVAVIPFDNETADPSWTRFGESLTDNVVERLAAASDGRFQVIGNAAILRTSRDRRDLTAIGASLNANYVILGQVQRDGTRIRVLGHLIRLPEQVHVAVARFDGLSDQSLAATDDIAARITAKFVDPLGKSGS